MIGWIFCMVGAPGGILLYGRELDKSDFESMVYRTSIVRR
jgi:hypothetical protein